MYDQLLNLINERQDQQKMIERQRVLKRVSCLKNNVVGARPKQGLCTECNCVIRGRGKRLRENFEQQPKLGPVLRRLKKNCKTSHRN